MSLTALRYLPGGIVTENAPSVTITAAAWKEHTAPARAAPAQTRQVAKKLLDAAKKAAAKTKRKAAAPREPIKPSAKSYKQNGRRSSGAAHMETSAITAAAAPADTVDGGAAMMEM